MISDDYKRMNAQLHAENAGYGVGGQKHSQKVLQLAMDKRCATVLDFGCGKATLADALPQLKITNYDPAIPEFSATPAPHELVVCTDVAEHVEPEHLDAWLDELARLSKRYLYLTVATRPAVKTLPDGRNAHLTVEDFRWWLPKIWQRFDLEYMEANPGEFTVICVPGGSFKAAQDALAEQRAAQRKQAVLNP